MQRSRLVLLKLVLLAGTTCDSQTNYSTASEFSDNSFAEAESFRDQP